MSEAVLPWRELRVARVTVEALAPLSVTTGLTTGLFDSALVRDADGLPAIPGTALAGVLRQLTRRHLGSAAADDVFGPTATRSSEGKDSKIGVSWARIHGRDDRPAVPRPPPGDAFLASLRRMTLDEPSVRDRVRLNERGVADAAERGKFDRSVIPRGTRFTFHLHLWSTGSPQERQRWLRILGLMNQPLFAVGGAVRSGLGRLVPRRIRTTAFDLVSPRGRDAFRAARAPRDGFLTRPDHPWPEDVPDVDEPTIAKPTSTVMENVDLEATDFLRVGPGRGPLPTANGRSREPDLCPFVEPVVEWSEEGEGSIQPWLVIPGSGIKGALRHRTAFHLGRLLKGSFAEETSGLVSDEVCIEERRLFGDAKGRSIGHAGRVFVDDVPVAKVSDPTVRSAVMPHNSIDRFTAGVRDGFLFSEQILWRIGGLRLRVVLDDADPPVSDVSKRALRMAIEDLRTGALALGGGTGRGHGTLRGVKDATDGQ
jgi:CRISPR/Cas system CMR subunit Cmr4 (Cas7 group RAMP superfamily)